MTVDFYDIECLINFFSITCEDKDTGEVKVFVLHESRDDLIELYNYLKQKNLYQIGFNCINYDVQLLEFILEKESEWYYTYPDIKDVIDEIYQFSQDTINRPFPKYPEWELKIPQLDLFKVWHFDNRAKMTSWT